jgi:hypothetical protein
MCEVYAYMRCPAETKYQVRDRETLVDFMYKLNIIGKITEKLSMTETQR